LNVDQTDGGDFGVQFWIGAPGVGCVLLERTQIDELITDLLLRRALIANRRAGSERSDR